MTDLVTREDHVRNALVRLNPEFHEHDISWGSLASILDERDKLRDALKVALFKLDGRLSPTENEHDEHDFRWVELIRRELSGGGFHL